MLGCSTVCPNCKHQFQCCPPALPSPCCLAQTTQRSAVVLPGGNLMAALPPGFGFPSPQVSPSVPLSFVMPPPFRQSIPPPALERPEAELEKLAATVRALRLSGWYYEGLTYVKSDELLKDTKVGTFLVRNSADPRYLFSLSVQTENGPVSVRLFYMNGHFRLDAQQHLQGVMPIFPGVVELVQYYRKRKTQRQDGHVWIDPTGKRSYSIFLDQPLRAEKKPASLKHLTRMTINGAVNGQIKVALLGLPTALMAYLEEYPYTV